jgi:hypothetical protein
MADPVRPHLRVRAGVLVVLLLLTALGGALRLYRLDYPGLSFDEAYSWGVVRFSPQDIVRRTSLDVHPPLYYLLLAGWLEVWGAAVSPRCLSVLLGTLCIPLVYRVCRDSDLESPVGSSVSDGKALQGALLSAWLLAVSSVQIEASRNLRMYSLGVLLAGLSSWLLLRALKADRNRTLWWAAYGLGNAAFCYTHNFALFTVLAQTLFVAGECLAGWRGRSTLPVRPTLEGFLLAGGITLALYAPWVPVLAAQSRAVRQSYWTPDLTEDRVERMLFSWSSGALDPGGPATWLWFAFLAGVCLWAFWKGGRAGRFFLLQAFVPWLLCLGVALLTGRSLLVERCLAFAQFSWLALVGVVWRTLPGTVARLLLGAVFVFGSLLGLEIALVQVPDQPFVMTAAARMVAEHSGAADVFLVDSAERINQTRYHLARAGVRGMRVQCARNPGPVDGPLHFDTCLPSLAGDDFLPPRGPGEVVFPGRFWWGTSRERTPGTVPADWKLLLSQTFTGARGSCYTLTLVERAPPSPTPPSRE